jgi:hypothetical protein
MKQSDDGLLQQLGEVRERVRAYEAPPEVVELPKGVVPVAPTSTGPAETAERGPIAPTLACRVGVDFMI